MHRYGKFILIISAVMICAAGAILPFAFASSRERDEEAYSKKELLVNRVIDENDLHIGIGIGGGIVKFGEFGQSHRDLTAIGSCEYRCSSTNCSQRRPDFGDSYCSGSKQRGERHRLWRSKEIPFEGISKSHRPI